MGKEISSVTQEPLPPQNPRLTPIGLHAAIVETLWAQVSAGSLEHVCDLLGMPAAPRGVEPMSSKRIYARERLKRVEFEAMVEIAQTIVAECDDTPLLDELLGPPGVRDVDGEFKNLIFAAHGPKPRIVLKDAINNIIDIVDHADRCLVCDRPLPRSYQVTPRPPRPATSDTAKGSQTTTADSLKESQLAAGRGAFTVRRTSPTQRIQTASLKADAGYWAACNARLLGRRLIQTREEP